MNTNLEIGGYWAGTEEGLALLKSYQEQIKEAPAELTEKVMSSWDDEQEEEDDFSHPLLEVMDNVAIITVDGPMIAGHAGWWGRWMGVIGYYDIQDAIVAAINQGLTEILMVYETPGGSVRGIDELSQFMNNLPQETNLTAYSGGQVTSGGVWLAVVANQFFASRMAEIGSVGVIAVVMEVTKMLEEEGITARVFKSTPLKASGNPWEKLDNANAQEIQSNLDETHGFFVRQISEHRGLTEEFVSENIANGKVWFAAEANELQVIDGIRNFDDVLFALIDRTDNNSVNQSNF